MSKEKAIKYIKGALTESDEWCVNGEVNIHTKRFNVYQNCHLKSWRIDYECIFL